MLQTRALELRRPHRPTGNGFGLPEDMMEQIDPEGSLRDLQNSLEDAEEMGEEDDIHAHFPHACSRSSGAMAGLKDSRYGEEYAPALLDRSPSKETVEMLHALWAARREGERKAQLAEGLTLLRTKHGRTCKAC